MAETKVIAKKLAKIVGLHKIFTTLNLEEDPKKAVKYAYKPLLKSEISSNNGSTVDENTLMFIVADATDDGRYIYVGLSKLNALSGPILVEQGDVFIWVKDMIVATSANYIDSISASNADDAKIEISIDDKKGDLTISATHNAVNEDVNSKNATAIGYGDNDNKIITKIAYDSTGHIISADSTDLNTLDTTYTLSGAEDNGVHTITLKASSDTDDKNSGTYTIDAVPYLYYGNGSKATVDVNNITSPDASKIPTQVAVINAINDAISGGSKFLGVDTVDNILDKTSVANGDMWKVGADSATILGDKYAANENDLQTTIKKGDVLIASVSTVTNEGTTTQSVKWWLVPSGDDVEDTWRQINVITELDETATSSTLLGNSTSGDITFKSSEMITVNATAEGADGVIAFEHNKTSVTPTDHTTGEGEEAITTKVYELGGTTNPVGKIILDEYGHITEVTSIDMSANVAASIKGLTFKAADSDDDTGTDNGAVLNLGIKTSTSEEASADTQSVSLIGDGSVKVTCADNGLVFTGTTYTTANTTVATADYSNENESVKTGVTITTGLTDDTKTHTIESVDASISITPDVTNNSILIDYTGASTADDWAVL